MLKLSSIDTIIVQWMGLGHSGGNFLNSLFDNHDNLLTVPFGGMANFHYIYEKYLKNNIFKDSCKNVIDAQKHDKYIFRVTNLFFKNTNIDYNTLFSIMSDLYFANKYIPTKSEWFKSFYISYAIALNKKIDESNPPSIYFYTHAIGQYIPINNYYEIFKDFKKFYGITIIRRPSYAIASFIAHLFSLVGNENISYANYSGVMKILNNEIFPAAFGMISSDKSANRGPLLISKNDKYFPYRRCVRFEDLKLKPFEILSNICNFFNIKFDDNLLKCTENGSMYNFYSSSINKNIIDFDLTPVFNPHKQIFSEYDHKRIEILFRKIYKLYDYEPYFDDYVEYFNDDLLSLFDEPFLFEEKFLKLNNNFISDNEIQRCRTNFKNIISTIINIQYPIIDRKFIIPIQLIDKYEDPFLFNDSLYNISNNIIFNNKLPFSSIDTPFFSDYPKNTPFRSKIYDAMFDIEINYAQNLISDIIKKDIEGDIVEFGVHEGRWINILYNILNNECALDRQIFGFDSFEGLPAHDEETNSPYYTQGKYKCSYDRCYKNVQVDLRNNIHLVKGLFCETLKNIDIEKLKKFVFIRIDCDLYEAAKDCLSFISHRIVDNAILVFDDWSYTSRAGETRAFFEWIPTVPHLKFEYLAFPMAQHLYIRVHKN